MRKGISDNKNILTPFSLDKLASLAEKGFKFVQVKGFSADFHYEYIETHHLLLIPLKELPDNQEEKDIYEPVDSEMLRAWAIDNTAAMVYIVTSAAK